MGAWDTQGLFNLGIFWGSVMLICQEEGVEGMQEVTRQDKECASSMGFVTIKWIYKYKQALHGHQMWRNEGKLNDYVSR